jgi:hypothetical protein
LLTTSETLKYPKASKNERCFLPNPQNDARVKALRSAPLDSWVALSADESKIVAIGETYEQVVSASESAGADDPVIVKTPKVWASLSI